MERVTGIGGLFFRARDPDALGDWYARHLGIAPVPGPDGGAPWMQTAGPCVFAPFREDSDYFGADRRHMVNFRVADLDAMTMQLQAAGVAVEDHGRMEGVGRFARIHDPEGNPIELWQPAV